MELIEHYRPEFVARFNALEAPCGCPSCQKGPHGWPQVSKKMKNQQRETLDIACESAARELLLNPRAFVLDSFRAGAQGEEALTPWSETLNQQCINLAVNPHISLECSLFAIGTLLSKAQQYLDGGNDDPVLLVSLGEQFGDLASQGILQDQFEQLPFIEENRVIALKEMGTLRLNLNLPMAQKMGLMLRLSELSVMPHTRLCERLHELESRQLAIALFTEQLHVLRNLLIYRLYSDVFPGIGCTDYGSALLSLTRQFFQIKMLCAIRADDVETFSEEDAVCLLSAWSGWKQPAPALPAGSIGDSLLYGLSLI